MYGKKKKDHLYTLPPIKSSKCSKKDILLLLVCDQIFILFTHAYRKYLPSPSAILFQYCSMPCKAKQTFPFITSLILQVGDGYNSRICIYNEGLFFYCEPLTEPVTSSVRRHCFLLKKWRVRSAAQNIFLLRIWYHFHHKERLLAVNCSTQVSPSLSRYIYIYIYGMYKILG